VSSGGAASGNAGTSSAGQSAGGTANGNAGASGAVNVEHCGGDFVATWTGEVPQRVPKPSLVPIDTCWNLMFYDAGGTLSASCRLSGQGPEVKRYVTVHFEVSPVADPGTLFTLTQEEKGPVTQHFGPDCMMFGDRQVACEELDEPLTQAGLGEGSWRSVICSPAADGGCDCLLDYWAVGGSVGTWDAIDDRLVLHYQYYDYETNEIVDVTSAPIDYCVTDDTLLLGEAVNEAWEAVGGQPLTRLDCEDGVQGPGEQGIDCGYRCPTACPATQ
jgi:hypothetical protein